MSEKQLLHRAADPLNPSDRTLRMVQMAMLVAISSILVFACFPLVPAAPFLKYDMADVPILLATMSMGAPCGLLVLVVAAAIQAFLLGHDGPIGFLMHVVSSGTLILVAKGMSRLLPKTNWGKIAALAAGSIAMAAIMIPMNFIFTPKVMMNVPIAESASIFFDAIAGGYDAALHSEAAVTAFETVNGLLLVGLIPFNLLTAGLNSAIYFGVDKALPKIFKGKRAAK